jgi:hypothetical protein
MKRRFSLVADIGNGSSACPPGGAGYPDELKGGLPRNPIALAAPGVEGVQTFAAMAEVCRIALSNLRINAVFRFELIETAQGRNWSAAWAAGTPVSESRGLGAVSPAA